MVVGGDTNMNTELKTIYKVNKLLAEGKRVSEVRDIIGMTEKPLQKLMKRNGYKLNQRTKQYECVVEGATSQAIVVEPNANALQVKQEAFMGYLYENSEILSNVIERFKSTTEATTSSTTEYITINLKDDKHLNPKPHSLRVNEFIWEDWQKFCDNEHYSKMDLVSMALKEYMEKYSK